MTRPKLFRLSKIQLLKKNIKCKEPKVYNELRYEKCNVECITARFLKQISLIHKIEHLIDALIKKIEINDVTYIKFI
jgi:hypothetical protein